MGGTEKLQFGSRVLAERQKSIYALFRVMLGWNLVKPIFSDSKRLLERLEGPQVCSQATINDAGFYADYYYVATYADFFKHASLVPHML